MKTAVTMTDEMGQQRDRQSTEDNTDLPEVWGGSTTQSCKKNQLQRHSINKTVGETMTVGVRYRWCGEFVACGSVVPRRGI
jgi:hypothetical protein